MRTDLRLLLFAILAALCGGCGSSARFPYQPPPALVCYGTPNGLACHPIKGDYEVKAVITTQHQVAMPPEPIVREVEGCNDCTPLAFALSKGWITQGEYEERLKAMPPTMEK